MKKVLLTLGLCIALTAAGSAQQTDTARKMSHCIEMHPFAGVRLINSNWSPAFGFAFDLHFIDQAGRSRYKAGLEYMINTIGTLDKASFNDLTKLSNYDLKLMSNTAGTGAKPLWLGISIGYMTASGGGDLDKRVKTGVVLQKQSFGIAADFFKNKAKQENLAVTLKYYF